MRPMREERCVVKEGDLDFEKYEPRFPACGEQSLKHPDTLYLDDEEVKV
jgi:hypothetical protein